MSLSSLQVFIVVIALICGLGCAAKAGGKPKPPPLTITSTPVTAGTEDQLYLYDVASNVEGQPSTMYRLDDSARPDGMSIEPSTGIIRWKPTNAQVGVKDVMVEVKESSGASATQSFAVTVANALPVFTAGACAVAKIDAAYRSDIQTDDEGQGDTKYSPSPGQWPTGMGIDERTGVIDWTPTSAQAGTHTITVQVDDGHGGTASQSFTITVTATGTRVVVSLDGKALHARDPATTMDLTGGGDSFANLSTDQVHDLQLLTCTLYRLTSVVANSPVSSVTIAVTGDCQAIVAP